VKQVHVIVHDVLHRCYLAKQ